MLAVLLCMFLVLLLRPYSHGTNITRGSHVIYNLSRHVRVSCDAFSRDRQSLYVTHIY